MLIILDFTRNFLRYSHRTSQEFQPQIINPPILPSLPQTYQRRYEWKGLKLQKLNLGRANELENSRWLRYRQAVHPVP
jgi:hypothetical protein